MNFITPPKVAETPPMTPAAVANHLIHLEIQIVLYNIGNVKPWKLQKFDNSTSSEQNSILKKGGGRTFLFQTEYLSINIDFSGQKL